VLAALKPNPWPNIRTSLAVVGVVTFGILALCDGSSLWAEGYHHYEVLSLDGNRYKIRAVRLQDGALRILGKVPINTEED
jgi:hypothetical protein